MDIEPLRQMSPSDVMMFKFLATMAAIMVVAFVVSVAKAVLGRLIRRYRWRTWSSH